MAIDESGQVGARRKPSASAENGAARVCEAADGDEVFIGELACSDRGESSDSCADRNDAAVGQIVEAGADFDWSAGAVSRSVDANGHDVLITSSDADEDSSQSGLALVPTANHGVFEDLDQDQSTLADQFDEERVSAPPLFPRRPPRLAVPVAVWVPAQFLGIERRMPKDSIGATAPTRRNTLSRRCEYHGFCDPSDPLGCGGELCGKKPAIN